MAYDEDLAYRVRDLLEPEKGLREKKMFGGITFMINGHMAVTVSGRGGLMLRVDPEQTEALLRDEHAQPFEMRGRPMNGWLRIDPAGIKKEADLERWAALGVSYARSLKPKPSKR
ncbi:MAG TPA: TfoX/Sxy family protein [Frankiaceae bacterium]|jgi:TfoX/Sxy family transcriptional regulator of competence genes|nr:TfoX/Sxy family protein [Frankiaceae bacterium]